MKLDHSLHQIAKYQWNQILNIRQIWLMLLVFPLLLAVFICYIYQENYLRDMPTVLVDMDNSHTSHLTARYLDSHRYIRITETVSSLPEGHKLLQSRKAYALIMIPLHYERDIKKGKQTSLKAYSFGANLVVGRELQKAVTEIILTINSKLNFARTAAMKQNWENQKKEFPPVKADIHNLFNPQYNYQSFVPPGIIIAIWQLLLVLSVAIIWSTEFEKNTWQRILSIGNRNIFIIWLGRLLPILAIWIIQWLILILVIFPLFHIPVRGELLQGLLTWVLFIMIVYHYGSTISVLSKDSIFSVTVCSLTLAGAFAFSGYTYPFWEIPLIPRMFANIMPTTHYLPCFQAYYQQGISGQGYLIHWYRMLLYSLIVIIISTPVWLHLSHKVGEP